MNKKGSALDLIYYSIAIFGLSAFLLVVWKMWGEMSTGLQAVGTSSVINRSIASGTTLIGMFDFMFIGSVIAMLVVLIIIALMIPSNPIFYVIYVLYLIVATLLAPILSNAYETFANTSQLQAASAAMPMQNLFMSNLPLIILMFGVILLIATYAKVGGGYAER